VLAKKTPCLSSEWNAVVGRRLCLPCGRRCWQELTLNIAQVPADRAILIIPDAPSTTLTFIDSAATSSPRRYAAGHTRVVEGLSQDARL